MSTAETTVETPPRKLRLWPGVVIVLLQWVIRFVVPIFEPEALQFAVLGGLAAGLLVVLWWLFFSRAPWVERLGALALIVVAMLLTPQLLHPSIATGMMGMLFPIYAIPVVSLALVAWAVASQQLSRGPRRATLVVAILLACGVFTLLRTGGITGSADSDFKWRWAETAEERLLAQTDEETSGAPTVAIQRDLEPEWPGFRGPGRDGVVPGVRLETDWVASPPVELWRQPIGPGWSSFAVHGDLLYTQEQRGDEEVVACYRRSTGEPIWRHGDAARFWESNGGAGPRGTPTLAEGRVYSLGATGILNALDALDGRVVWSRDTAADTETKTPEWGFSSSPLVLGETVVVAVAGRLAAYDAASGEPRWFGPAGTASYSSPHLLTIDGVEQVLLLDGEGLTSVEPTDGAVLWEHPWDGYPIVQPAVAVGGDVLISVSDQSGTRRLAITQEAGGWKVEERWTSIGLKSYFNDFVVHEGHAYGFDGSILAAIDVENGERAWKGGRYGHGQLLLLAEQDLLLVLSEQGELALVEAKPDGFSELARFPAIEGKTWNHPVLADGILLVRNAQEMAAFRLPLAEG